MSKTDEQIVQGFLNNWPLSGEVVGKAFERILARKENDLEAEIRVLKDRVAQLEGDLVYAIIPCDGVHFLIDKEDVEKLSGLRLRLNVGGTGLSYVVFNKDGEEIPLHRFLLNAPDEVEIDHANRNTLDNRKSNLRFCTRIQNCWNVSKRTRPSTSRFKGVCWAPKSNGWEASIQCSGKRLRRIFATELEAAAQYNEWAKEHFGEFAALNNVSVAEDPRLLPQLPEGWRLDGLSEFHDGWLATLRHREGKIIWSHEHPEERPPTARAACKTALAKIGKQS